MCQERYVFKSRTTEELRLSIAKGSGVVAEWHSKCPFQAPSLYPVNQRELRQNGVFLGGGPYSAL